MSTKRQVPLLIMATIGIFTLLIMYIPSAGTSAADGPSEIDISTTPQSQFISMDNLKPGDRVIANLRVHNNGLRDFQYEVTALKNAGADQFYNHLTVEVEDENGVIYSGSLSNLQELPARLIKSMAHEDLRFAVKFPFGGGNSLQGLSTEVEFIFQVSEHAEVNGDYPGSEEEPPAEDTADDSTQLVPPSDTDRSAGLPLPDTATNMYNILLIGLALLVVSVVLYVIAKKKRLPKRIYSHPVE